MRGAPNERLRRAREDRQESREEFAGRVQACSGEPCDERTVKRWEDGTVQRPRPIYRRAVMVLTGRSAAELGWADTDDASPGISPALPVLDAADLLATLRRAETSALRVQGPDRYLSLDAVSRTYCACALALLAAGDHPAAWVAADRAVTAAEASADLVLMAEAVAGLAAVLAASGHPDRARRTASSALRALSASGRIADVDGASHRLGVFAAPPAQ